MFFSSIFSEGVDVYTTTFPQMLSKCLIGVATLLICFAVSYDQQHFLNEKELNRQIDQQKGYYHALTEQVLAEREARHNFRHQCGFWLRRCRSGWAATCSLCVR